MDPHGPHRPPFSGFRPLTVAWGTLRHWARRYQLVRILAGLTLGGLTIGTLHSNQQRTDELQTQWGQTQTVWVTTEAVPAGAILTGPAVTTRAVPVRFVPDGPVGNDPTGTRVRTTLHRGEVILEDRLASAQTSEITARTPRGWITLALPEPSALFRQGDRVDLHHRHDGVLLAANAVVVSLTDHYLGVAVEPGTVTAVIAALGQGGIVTALRG